ncbi:MAG: sensor histidine kinase [Candidatus Thorarchaeota archaeon]
MTGDLSAIDLIQALNVPMIVLDARGFIENMNPSAEKLFGRRLDEIQGEHFIKLSSANTSEDTKDKFDLALENGRGYCEQVTLVDNKEKTLFVQLSITTLKDAKDLIGSIIVTIQEISTVQDITENSLRMRETHFRELYKNTQVGMFSCRITEGKLVECNDRLADMLGYESVSDALDGFRISRCFVEPAMEMKMFDELQRNSQIDNFSVEIKRHVGNPIWIEWSATLDPVKDIMVGVAVDVTERKHAEDEARRRAKVTKAINRILIKTLASKTSEDVARVSLDVAQEITSSKYGIVVESTSKDTINILALTDPGWKACTIEHSAASFLLKGIRPRGLLFKALKSGESIIANNPETHPDRVGPPKGHPPISSFMGVPLKLADETIGMIGLVGRDEGYDENDIETIESISIAFVEVAKRKKDEQRIELIHDHAEFFVDLMGHDLSNIHQAVSGIIELLIFNEDTPSSLNEIINEALHQVDRATNLITDVKKFRSIENKPSELVVIDLSETLSKAVRVVQESYPNKQLVIHTDLDSRNFKVYADEMLKDVFYCVLHNSMRNDPLDVVEVDLIVERLNEGKYLKISIIDNGEGISDAMKENVFERIAKKKEGFWGTGMGLTLSKRVIEHYGGQIWVEDRVSGDYTNGASISFTLQIAEIS